MPWFAVDDELHCHPKRMDLLHQGGLDGHAALGLWSTFGSWCADNLTDGFVPDAIVDYLASLPPEDTMRIVGLLLDVGFLERTEQRGRPGVQLVDYLDRNPSAEQVRLARAMKSARQAKWRAKKDAVTKKPAAVDRLHDASRSASRDTSADAAPSPPIPKGGGGYQPDPDRPVDNPDVDGLHDATTTDGEARANARAVADSLRR